MAILGLGSTDYSAFCGAPKKLDKLLTESGAVKVLKTVLADDATGLEEHVEPWKAVSQSTFHSHLTFSLLYIMSHLSLSLSLSECSSSNVWLSILLQQALLAKVAELAKQDSTSTASPASETKTASSNSAATETTETKANSEGSEKLKVIFQEQGAALKQLQSNVDTLVAGLKSDPALIHHPSLASLVKPCAVRLYVFMWVCEDEVLCCAETSDRERYQNIIII